MKNNDIFVDNDARLRHCSLFTVHRSLSRRRGVTLLLVLGLMTMFALLTVTFMVVTTQARRAAETAAKIKDLGGIRQGTQDTRLAVHKLLVGDKLQSVIGPWSILEDLYGHPVDNGVDQLTGVFSTMASNKMRDADDGGSPANPIPGIWMFNDSNLSFGLFGSNPAPLELAGSVLTVTELSSNAPATLLNRSFRIFMVRSGASDAWVYIVPSGNEFQQSDFDGCTYVINGAPFGGTGPGFDSTATGPAMLTVDDGDSTPTTLSSRPNILAPNASDGSQAYKTKLNVGMMMNSDYTAPDALHPFLTWIHSTITNGNTVIDSIVPSFHRPVLLNGVTLTDANVVRKHVLRPTPFDHPDFDGGNSYLNATNFATNIKGDVSGGAVNAYPWDVDNDGDGIPDSVWIDAGLGTYTDPKTNKTYKKLVSYLVLDMDGRLNVNTHGNIIQAENQTKFDNVSSADDPMQAVAGSVKVRGSGNGPAEVWLTKALGLSATASTQVMQGKIDTTGTPPANLPIVGRYGKENLLLNPAGDQPYPGNPSLNTGNLPTDDTNTAIWFRQKTGVAPLAYDYNGGVFNDGTTSYSVAGGLVPDWWGQAAVSFDPLGNRVINLFASPLDGSSTPPIIRTYGENPYLMNPYGKNAYDSPFSLEQLESVLRTQGDADFGALPQQLRILLGEGTPSTTSNYRFQITTRSSDLPTPSRFMVSTDGTNNIADWSLHRKVYRAVGSDPDKAATLLNLLPIEVRQGLRVNLNRPSLSANWASTDPNYDHAAGLRERAKFAQEIFYLLMVLNYDELFGASPYTEGTMTPEDMITRLAQWSVNLVDYMDPDATMTPFVFSVDPFAATTLYDNNNEGETGIYSLLDVVLPDGNNPSTFSLSNNADLRLIWGMEKPEVAITETLGTHNRCVADSIKESGTSTKENCLHDPPCIVDKRRYAKNCEGGGHDADFDQVIRPEGSLFVELYRCGNPGRSALSPEIADDTDPTLLDLAKKTPNGPSGQDYIWRLAISDEAQTTQSRTPGAPGDVMDNSTKQMFQPRQWPGSTTEDPNLLDSTPIEVERFVWFDNADPTTSEAAGLTYSYKNAVGSDTNTKLSANEYLVVGPRTKTSFASKPVDDTTTTFGVESGADGTFIDLANLNIPANARPPKHMVATNGTVGVNVSEKTGVAYSNSVSGTPTDTGMLKDHGTIPCYRSIFLQRLADPTRNYHPMTNPYITVDWSAIDLHIFTSEVDSNASHNNEEPDLTTPDASRALYFGSRQWGFTGGFTAIEPNVWDRNWQPSSDAATAGLASTPQSLDKIVPPDAPTFPANGETFGYLNKFSDKAEIGSGAIYVDNYVGAPKEDAPFTAFAWNDSPFANVFEIMQVPASTPGRFGIEFHDRLSGTAQSLGGGQRFRSEETDSLGYLLSFESSDVNNGTVNSLNLGKFLDQVCVPSRFNGTVVGMIPATATDPPQMIYAYQEPGKINLNTVTDAAWTGLQGNRTNWEDYSDLLTQVQTQPFRSSSSAALAPDASQVPTHPIETTLLRHVNGAGPGATNKFFKSEDSVSPVSNMYNEYENAARLSSMTTNRSNVFAVWVTVGYFEVQKFDKSALNTNKPEDLWIAHPTVKNNFPKKNASPEDLAYFDAVYPDGYVLGTEKGLDDGTVERHRGFFLIDRTIPVGFRRGEKLNSENVILLQRVLE